MQFEISAEEKRKAKVPHEILLVNLIGNHILWFVASLGIAKSYWQPLALVPIVSVSILAYIFWRGSRSKHMDSWYVQAHWNICMARSRLFSYMLGLLLVVSLFGWVGYSYLGMMDIAVKAIIGGVGLLPVMVTVLILIVMESDALHQANTGIISDGYAKRSPPPAELVVIED